METAANFDSQGEAVKGRDRLRRTLFKRVSRADDAGLTVLTVLRARAFLAAFPTYGPAWHRLGKALTDIARYEEAEQSLLKAIEYCPPEILWAPYGAMGQLFKASGDYGRAAEWFRRVIETDPDDAGGYIQLGGVLALQGRLAEAEGVHRRATQCAGGCLDEAFLNLGFVLRAQERFAEAAKCFEEAIRRDPDDQGAKRALRDVTACMTEPESSGGQGMTETPPCDA